MQYTEEQIARANQTDLVSFLNAQGEQLVKSGREYRWKKHDSVTISGNRWYRHSQSKGGYPVDFVMEFYYATFPEAVKMLIGEEGEAIFFRQGKNTTSVRRISKENFGRRSEKPPPHSCETRSTRSYFFGFERKRTRAAFHNGRIQKRLFPFSSVRL